VFITNASEDSGVVAARSLAKAGFEVFGADKRRMPRLVRSRHLSGYTRLKSLDGRARDAELIRLIAAAKADAYLPIGTRGVLAAIRHRDELSRSTAVNVVDAAGFMAAFDKLRCTVECEQLGIPYAAVLSTEEALSHLERGSDDRILVVKPRWDVGAASGVHYVRDRSALSAAIKLCTERFGGFMVQEFIPGGAETMKTVFLMFAQSGRLAAAFTTRKVRHWPQTGGPTAASRSTHEHELVDLVRPFFEKWRWRGVAEVELKLDARDGRHKVIEINPRFPGYIRFPWHCGLDVPALAVRLALGDEPAGDLFAYRAGVTYVAPTLFMRTLREDVRTHGMLKALGKAASDTRGGAGVVLGMLTDPLPLFARAISPTHPRGQFSPAMIEGLS
jgi:predicted ATP-grasp superfamily ATP-dependent carboligase